MDELNSSFGRLSTAAAEWKPGGGGQSDLQAAAVKEFVPGQGWSSVATPPASPTRSETRPTKQPEPEPSYQNQTHNEQPAFPSVLPTGPTPAPLPTLRALQSLAMPDDLWRYHRDMALEANRQMEGSDPRHKAVPLPYCNAFCLDEGRTSTFGYPQQVYQVTNSKDGHLYCLRRFDNCRTVSPKIAAAVTDRWSSIVHSGVVPLYQNFVAQRAVFFCHAYIPGARSLRERLGGSHGGSLAEPAIWSCVTQLVAAVRAVHKEQLAVRCLNLQHVLSTSDSVGSRLRLRLNCVGVVDALEFESRKHVVDLQRQDIRDLGCLILSLATGTEVTFHGTESGTFRTCEAYMGQHYSRELHNLTMTLIQSSPHPPSIVEVSRAIAQRALEEQEVAYRALDRAERALSAEYDSGRAFRLLLKLGFINERPEFGPNRRWSQSGDCYVLTLFRDYVFHQADGAGNPVMDLGHVVTALNKLDAADEEKVVLSSRDGKSLMVVSYADIARCLESAFHELCSGAVPASALQQY